VLIRFTKHAERKFGLLRLHGVNVSQEQVIETIEKPDRLDVVSRYPLAIAQGELDKRHVLRVVYRHERGGVAVITFYPGRKSQYEK